MKYHPFPAIAFLAICLSAPAAWGQRGSIEMPPGPVYISGVVRDEVSHLAIPYVRVILESDRAGYVTETNTDTQGKFRFDGLNHMVYVVRIKLPGYKGAEQITNACNPASCKRVDLSLASMDYITFGLVPLPSNEAPAVPPGGPAASINVAEEQIPEAARKEFAKGQEILDAGKNPGESIAHFKKAIELYPAYDQAYFRIGMIYMDQKSWKEAEAALGKATELNTHNPGAFLALGTAYAQEKDFAAAEKALQRGLELNPEVAEAQCEMSRTYWALRKFPESDAHAQKCASLKPDYAPAHLLLGNLALAKRDKAGALREYREYVRLDPQGPYAAAVREQVSRLEKEMPQAQAK